MNYSGITVISRTSFKIMQATNSLVFKSVDSILEVLNSYKDNSNVAELLKIYYKKKEQGNAAGCKKFPFIAFEGLDGCGKSSLSKKLSKKRGAVQWNTPPLSIKHLRSYFDNDLTLHTAFYSLGNYIAAEEIKVILTESAVILDRYWHSTASYALAQAIHDKPSEYKLFPVGDDFYTWPTDLLKPDMVIFLDVDEENRLERISRRQDFTEQECLLKLNAEFRENIVTAYERMVNPKIQKVNSNASFIMTLKKLLHVTEPLFVQ